MLIKPGPSEGPVPVHSPLGKIEDLRGLLDGQANEKTKLDHLGGNRVFLGQF